MANETSNRLRLRSRGQEYTLVLDVSQLMGDMLEELETHLGEEGVIAWLQRMVVAFDRGVRTRDLRTRDILGMVFLARSQSEPGITWEETARMTAPYSVEFLDDTPPVVVPEVPAAVEPVQAALN